MARPMRASLPLSANNGPTAKIVSPLLANSSPAMAGHAVEREAGSSACAVVNISRYRPMLSGTKPR